MVFPLIPLILVVGTVATVGLQAKDSFFPEKQINTVTVSRQPKKQGVDLSNFSNYQIGGISIFPIIAIVVIILFMVILK